MMKAWSLGKLRRVLRRMALMKLQRNPQLWQELTTYRQATKSTGCSWSDLWTLYKTVRSRKPREILECGPGVSTLVISYALMENEREGHPGRITAMEELSAYHEMAMKLHPECLRPYVEFILSPRVEDHYSLFRGVRYRDVPERPYDFVFVDGPDLYAPSDGAMTFDFDYIHVVRNSEKPVYGIVDYRLSTCYVFQVIFGLDKARFSAIHELGFVGPCDKHDLAQLDLEPLTAVLLRNARLLGNTEVRLR